MADLTAEQKALIDNASALRKALGIMIRTFNVKTVDPLMAFASIEKARAVYDRTASVEQEQGSDLGQEQAEEDEAEQEQGRGR